MFIPTITNHCIYTAHQIKISHSHFWPRKNKIYRRTSARSTWLGNAIVDHSDVVHSLTRYSRFCSWSTTCRRCSNYIFILDLTPRFNGLDKDNCNTRRESFKFWDLMCLLHYRCYGRSWVKLKDYIGSNKFTSFMFNPIEAFRVFFDPEAITSKLFIISLWNFT